MPYLATVEAIKARLQGKHPKYVAPLPDLPKEWDFESPDNSVGVEIPAKLPIALKPSAYTRVSTVDVPIYFFDNEGARFEKIYPSFSYEILDVPPRYNEYIYMSPSYKGDRYQIDQESPQAQLYDTDGTDLGVSKRLALVRDVEQPIDIIFEIRAYSKDPILSALMVEYIYKHFQPRDFIRVMQKDGTHRSWDMFFKTYHDMDKREAVRSGTPGVEREYCKVWTYSVEGYMDNTDEALFRALISRRQLNAHPLAGASGTSEAQYANETNGNVGPVPPSNGPNDCNEGEEP